MPELPEVEVIRRRIAPLVEGRTIISVHVNTPKLRKPIPKDISDKLVGQCIVKVDRRGKYLLLRCTAGTVMLHLGMTGDVRIVPDGYSPGRHDHLDIVLSDDRRLRFNDPRKFGSVLWSEKDPLDHPLLQKLGPEPLSDAFSGRCLFLRSRGRRITVKQLIMDGSVVSGLGNIYANEALFRAGIYPAMEAESISAMRFDDLAAAIREVLLDAIADGIAESGDSPDSVDKTVYFPVRLRVYGRSEEPCHVCGTSIVKIRLGGRSTFFCPECQREM